MVVATWNLAAPRSEAMRRRQEEHIARVAPDVWVFTESHDLVRSGHRRSHASKGGRDRDDDLGTRWVAITTDYDMTPIVVSDPVRCAAARLYPPTGAPFLVFGTVLPWLGSDWRGHSASGGAAFAAALATQRDDWVHLRSLYPDDELVLAGDFNQDLASSHFYGSRQGRDLLQRALSEAGLIALTAGEQDPIRRDSPPRACIDHICLRSDSRWRATEIARWPELPVPDRSISDHFGVKVTLDERASSSPA